MKRVGRYIKWLFSGMGWFDVYMGLIWFFMGGGVIATLQNDNESRRIWFGLALVVVAVAILTLLYKGLKFSWNRFKEDDEKVFNILKDR